MCMYVYVCVCVSMCMYVYVCVCMCSIHAYHSIRIRILIYHSTQVFINNRDFASSQDGQTFACSEYLRAVTLTTGQTAIADSENVCVYERMNDNVVKGVVRGFVYLVPTPTGREGDMYMQIGPRAVAVYDYAVEMKRVG